MTFEEILDQAIAMLQRRGRVTYQTLKLQFQLDEEHLEAIKDAILFAMCSRTSCFPFLALCGTNG